MWKKQECLARTRVNGQSREKVPSPVCTIQSGDRPSPDAALGDVYCAKILCRGAKSRSDQLTSKVLGCRKSYEQQSIHFSPLKLNLMTLRSGL